MTAQDIYDDIMGDGHASRDLTAEERATVAAALRDGIYRIYPEGSARETIHHRAGRRALCVAESCAETHRAARDHLAYIADAGEEEVALSPDEEDAAYLLFASDSCRECICVVRVVRA